MPSRRRRWDPQVSQTSDRGDAMYFCFALRGKGEVFDMLVSRLRLSLLESAFRSHVSPEIVMSRDRSSTRKGIARVPENKGRHLPISTVAWSERVRSSPPP